MISSLVVTPVVLVSLIPPLDPCTPSGPFRLLSHMVSGLCYCLQAWRKDDTPWLRREHASVARRRIVTGAGATPPPRQTIP